MVFFFLASLMSFFLIYKNSRAFSFSNDPDITSENTDLVEKLQSSLVSSTLAAVMRSALVVNDFPLTFESNEPISINCQSGVINMDLNYTQFGLIRSYRSAQVSQTFYDLDCTNFTGFMFSLQACEGQKHCNLTPKQYWLTDDCLDDLDFYQEKFAGLLKVQCRGKYPSL